MQTIITKEGNIINGPKGLIYAGENVVIDKVNGEYRLGDLDLETEFCSAFKIEKEKLLNPKIENAQISLIKDSVKTEIEKSNLIAIEIKANEEKRLAELKAREEKMLAEAQEKSNNRKEI